MTNELRIGRTLAIPFAILAIFLIANPRTCKRTLVRSNAVVTTSSAAEPTGGGLIINSNVGAPHRQAVVNYPQGLDAARLQYLVEIDSQFAAPKTMACPKAKGQVASTDVCTVLTQRGYAEYSADGPLVLTREGILKLTGVTEMSDSWIVPVGQRKFISVERLDDTGDGKFLATVRWQWQPNEIGGSLLGRAQDHTLSAEFAGGVGHWVMNRYVKPPDNDWR
jgi:hypothetical protein